MNDPTQVDALMVMLVGAGVLAAVGINALSGRAGLPAVAGFMLLGILLRLVDSRWTFLNDQVLVAFRFMANLGVVALLFKIGLESHPRALLAKLPSASLIWIGGVILSAATGFFTAFHLLDIALVPALVIATAFTATSVGVSVAAWEESNALKSDNGELLVDVAELDDLSGIALMALLFALVPVLLGGQGELWPTLTNTAGLFALKFALFVLVCLLFATYGEHRLTRLMAGLRRPPERMLLVIGVGFLIAAFAGSLGFSLAIGALFAGLIFSGDPEAVKTEKSFQDLYAFVTPFFFISIGLHIDPAAMATGLGIGLVLMVAAVAGKIIGHGFPALLISGGSGGLLIGVSMIPRAEIAMVIMHQGQQLGPQVVPAAIYTAMVVVSIGTCLLAPLLLTPLLKRWPQRECAE
ncbi:MAG: cation:proton antiporter [Gammaproteobacteria bacterium]|nr:cation:proton antiporter [Gammaproteobacteria bacterium]